jgi:hypothetical protein
MLLFRQIPQRKVWKSTILARDQLSIAFSRRRPSVAFPTGKLRSPHRKLSVALPVRQLRVTIPAGKLDITYQKLSIALPVKQLSLVTPMEKLDITLSHP